MHKLVVLFVLALVACFGDVTQPASSSTTDAGAAIADSLACASCHGADLSGSDTPIGAGGALAYPPNLTPDLDTGLGSWTDDQIALAVTTGVDDQGESLCSAMPRFGSLDAGDLAALVAYLRSLPAVAHEVPDSECAEADLDDAGPDDAGVVIVTDDAPSCEGYADPTTASVCHACSGATCQPNGCFDGWYCELATSHCVSKPSGC